MCGVLILLILANCGAINDDFRRNNEMCCNNTPIHASIQLRASGVELFATFDLSYRVSDYRILGSLNRMLQTAHSNSAIVEFRKRKCKASDIISDFGGVD